jgi:hypothetical protein
MSRLNLLSQQLLVHTKSGLLAEFCRGVIAGRERVRKEVPPSTCTICRATAATAVTVVLGADSAVYGRAPAIQLARKPIAVRVAFCVMLCCRGANGLRLLVGAASRVSHRLRPQPARADTGRPRPIRLPPWISVPGQDCVQVEN